MKTQIETQESTPAVWQGKAEDGRKVWFVYDPRYGDCFEEDTKKEAMETWNSLWYLCDRDEQNMLFH